MLGAKIKYIFSKENKSTELHWVIVSGERVEEESNFIISHQEWLHRGKLAEFYRKYVLNLNKALEK